MSAAVSSVSALMPFSALRLSMIFSKLDLGSPITTSENIWMKRRKES